MPQFIRYIGIDYSGAEVPDVGLKGLRIYEAVGAGEPVQEFPPEGPQKYWTRKGIAHWLVERLAEPMRTIVGIDHGFSFPLCYFETYGLQADWPAFLEDFRRHWPTDEDHMYVDFIREGVDGNGGARTGSSRWRRLTEIRSGTKSVFDFNAIGSVAKSTYAGLPWLLFIRKQLGFRVHFWPYDGWTALAAKPIIAEVRPALWSKRYHRADRTRDEHDAYCIAAWLSRADRNGELGEFLRPDLTPAEQATAELEGWILGVPGFAR